MSSTVTKTKNSKQISCKVRMLDDQELSIQIDLKATGQDLFTLVCNSIDLLEIDYFALEYLDSHRNSCWLEMDKPVLKQVTETKFSFCVKFYTPDPGQLEEEFTRYLFALQIKRDLHAGILLCSDNTATLLASYIVQAEIGDYLESYNNNTSYIGNRKFFPHQTAEHETRIMNLHKNHIGQLPADADLNLLDIARKVELYGIKMHPAKDHEQVNLNLAVAHMGILVFQNITKINTFSWAKIRKLSFKRKKFLIKLQPEGYGYYKDTVEFYFDTRDECKNFWKKCIEYHAFFRCVTIKRAARSRSKILTRGSSFRYAGRTQKEMIEYAREHYVKNRTFNRSYSGTRVVAPVTGRSHRSPGSALKNSDTMRSQETNLSSMESARVQSRSVPTATNQTNQVSSTKTTDQTDTLLSTTPNDVYQQVYHDDSSTHGSRTLDSRFSRDKYDLSDGETTDEDEEKNKQTTTIVPTPSEQQTEKTVNGSTSPTVTSSVLVHADRQSPTNQIEERRNSKVLHENDENDKGKSPGVERINRSPNVTNEDEEEEEHSESNHKRENQISVEIYHYDKNNDQEANETPLGKRYSASLKMYVQPRNSSDALEKFSSSISNDFLRINSNQNEKFERNSNQLPLQIDRSLSIDFTRSPSGTSQSSSVSSIEPIHPAPVERILGSNSTAEKDFSIMNCSTPVTIVHIRTKPPSLPKMTDFIEYVDRRILPDKDSLSWQDDTIDEDQTTSLQEAKTQIDEDPIQLVRQLIESILTKIVEEEKQLLATVDRLVDQACSRALNLYRIERRLQLFTDSSHLPHHKSCMLRSDKKNRNQENNIDENIVSSRFRTKSSPAIALTTDWTDVSRKLAAQTCFAAYPSGSNSHQLDRTEFSTFSEAKLKFFNIIPNQEVVPSKSTISLPPMAHVPIADSSSSSTRSSRASSVSSYASSMHVPCPQFADSPMKRASRPLSARLLDLSDDSDSNLSTSLSTNLKTGTLPSIISTSHSLPSHSPLPQSSPALRTQRRHHRQQQHQHRGRSNDDPNSSSDDSLSNHLNKAAGFRSVCVPRNHHNHK